MGNKVFKALLALFISGATTLGVTEIVRANEDFKGHASYTLTQQALVDSSLENAKDIKLKFNGIENNIKTNHKTVEDLLNSKGIVVKDSTVINHKLSDKITKDMLIEINEVNRIERQSLKEVDFETTKKEDSSLYKDEEKVITEGEKGKVTSRVIDEYKNGILVKSETIATEVTKPKVDRVVAVGTKERPTYDTGNSVVEAGTPTGNAKTFYLSFYTDLPEENGGYSITASGENLAYGMVASNVYGLGTRIYLEGFGQMRVADTGGSHFNSSDRLDVFIPRRAGESDSAYKSRVNSMGRIAVTGYVK